MAYTDPRDRRDVQDHTLRRDTTVPKTLKDHRARRETASSELKGPDRIHRVPGFVLSEIFWSE